MGQDRRDLTGMVEVRNKILRKDDAVADNIQLGEWEMTKKT